MSMSRDYWIGVLLAFMSAATIGISGFVYKLGIGKYDNLLQYSVMVTFIGLVTAIIYYKSVKDIPFRILLPSPRHI